MSNQDSKINLNELDSFIPKIKMYSTDEEGTLKKIKNCLNDFSQVYKSKEANELNKSNDIFFRKMPILIENRQSYLKILRENKTRYSEAALETELIFKKLETPKTKVNKNV